MKSNNYIIVVFIFDKSRDILEDRKKGLKI